jgi:hypothetical protein
MAVNSATGDDAVIHAEGEGAALTDIAFEPVSSTEVSVAGKRNFQGGDKEAETALEIQGRRRRDKSR